MCLAKIENLFRMEVDLEVLVKEMHKIKVSIGEEPCSKDQVEVE